MNIILIKESLSEFKNRIRNRAGLAIAGAFALVIALSWNEAIKAVIDDIFAHFNIGGTTYHYKIIAALLTTAICVAGIMYFSSWGEVKK